ncbi:hypothetical protein V2J09_006051 [Rumex salicifolius]
MFFIRTQQPLSVAFRGFRMDPGVSSSSSPATAVDIAAAAASTKTVLGKYELGCLLGRGSFAKVYHGRCVKDDASVAIKIIDKSKTDSSMAPRIINEIAAMRRLNHPNVIRIHEVLATKTKIYMVMELAPGGDLYEKLSRRPDRRFPERMARRYFHQIVTALLFCHRHGVAHRDVKPQNILLAADGDVKISDFGLAALAAEGPEGLLLQTPCGTPAFAAPEVIARRGRYDGTKADAWSCGIILYVMLVGVLPFDDRNLMAMFRKTFRREFHFPSHLSRPARALIHQLLDPNPNTRLPIEDIAKSPWFNAAKFGPRSMSLGDLVSLNETNFDRVSSMNAFDIIGMNSQLDLSGLFEEEVGKKERRFISKCPAEEVAEKVVKVGGLLGYDVEKGKGGKIWLGRGRLLLVIEALHMGPELLVEIKVVQGGGCDGHGSGLIEEAHWNEINDGGATAECTTTILGKYRLGHLLGKGSFAKVHLAHSLTTNAAVAIKVTEKPNTNVAAAPLILREVTIMRRLNHPNILRVHELLATRTNIYLVMDLAHGGDLQAVLASRPGHRLRLSTALRVFHQLVSALHFCHQHGVSHRDLKPHNILLDQHGNIKLSDFGLSSVAGEGSVAAGFLLKSVCGTPAFMAPEVIGRQRYAGPKADAWSCGIILYAMLAGALPFDHYEGMSVMRKKMLRREFGFPPNFNETIMGLIYRLLDPDPDTRLSIKEIVRDSWFKTSKFGTKSLTLEELIVMYEGSFDMGLSGTAFDIIGSNYGLDLSGLVDDAVGRKRRRFMVDEKVGAVAERAVEVGGRLGYEGSGKDGKIWLKRGSLLVVVEVLEVAVKLSMVEVVVVEGCLCVYCGGGDGCSGGGDDICGGGMDEILLKHLS